MTIGSNDTFANLLQCYCNRSSLYLVSAGAVTAVQPHDAAVEVAQSVEAELRAVRAARRDCAEAGEEVTITHFIFHL